LLSIFCLLIMSINTVYTCSTYKILGKQCGSGRWAMEFYISLASRLACATCARRCARSEFCVPWEPFFVPCALWVGAAPAWESAIGVMSDAKPGIRML
jgi:hypothetical protein